MVCDLCHKNISVIQFTQYVGDQEKELNLCEECAKKNGISSKDEKMDFNLSHLIGSLLDAGTEQPEKKVCTGCGMSYIELKKEGRLGCEQCFWIFHKDLKMFIQNATGSKKHRGRLPENLTKVKTLMLDKAGLKRQLEKALGDENYEKAAKLRDKIERIEGGVDKNEY